MFGLYACIIIIIIKKKSFFNAHRTISYHGLGSAGINNFRSYE